MKEKRVVHSANNEVEGNEIYRGPKYAEVLNLW